MPGAAIGKSQAAQGSHLAREVEESEAKPLALEPQDSVGHQGKGHHRGVREPRRALPARQFLAWVDPNV